jgi:hypothetical protein
MLGCQRSTFLSFDLFWTKRQWESLGLYALAGVLNVKYIGVSRQLNSRMSGQQSEIGSSGNRFFTHK